MLGWAGGGRRGTSHCFRRTSKSTTPCSHMREEAPKGGSTTISLSCRLSVRREGNNISLKAKTRAERNRTSLVSSGTEHLRGFQNSQILQFSGLVRAPYCLELHFRLDAGDRFYLG